MNLDESSSSPSGIALLCDAEGIVLEIVRDELGLADLMPVGRSFTLLVDRESIGKALNFLLEVRTEGAAFDWELNVPIGGGMKVLHFGGAVVDEHLLIVAAATTNGVVQLYEDLMRIGNEQANALRTALKEQSNLARVQVERKNVFYDELSRLNNELANLQRELAKKNAELERLDDEKNQFLGMAAHDLRNPLGVIMGFSEFLLTDAAPVLNEEQREFLSIIHSSSEFMLELVNNLLDIATIESGKLRLNPWPTDLAALVEHNVALNQAIASKKEIRLSCEIEAGLPVLEIDAPKIEQVLNNLISNAIKFSYPHSMVEVRLARADDGVLLSVADQGQGIPAAELDTLFKPFARTSVKSTGGEGSIGLGLAIVRRIVNGHRGRIWVESEVDSGSTFYVWLPLSGPDGGEA